MPRQTPTSDGPRMRLGPRTYLLGGVAALSTFDPTSATMFGGIAGALILIFSRFGAQKLTAPTAWVSLLVAWVAASGLWSRNPYSVNVTLTWAALGLLFIAGRQLIQTRTQLRAVAIGYLIGAFLAVARLLIENPTLLGSGTSGRVTTIFDDVNINYVAYALVTGFALVVFLWTTAPEKTLLIKVSLTVTAVAIVVGVEMTQSRGALLGIACAVAWLLLWRLFKIHSLTPITIALITATIVIVSGIGDQASLQFETGDRATGTWSGRIPLWESARELWLANPVIGYGASSFAYVSDYLIAAHNVILDLAVGVGAIGVLIFVALLRASLWTGTRDAPASTRALLVGTFIAASAPAYLTGAWVTAPAAWVALVLFTQLDVLARDEGRTPSQEQAQARPFSPALDQTALYRQPDRRARTSRQPASIDVSHLWPPRDER